MPNRTPNSKLSLTAKPPRIPINNRSILQQIFLVALIGLIVFVFDYHCPFKAMFSIPCPGCGMTRALFALLQGHLALSLHWHALLVPSLIFLALYIFLWFKNKEVLKKWENHIILAWAILMLAYWIWRLIFVFPNSTLF